jgi:hypothetical protein
VEGVREAAAYTGAAPGDEDRVTRGVHGDEFSQLVVGSFAYFIVRWFDAQLQGSRR